MTCPSCGSSSTPPLCFNRYCSRVKTQKHLHHSHRIISLAPFYANHFFEKFCFGRFFFFFAAAANRCGADTPVVTAFIKSCYALMRPHRSTRWPLNHPILSSERADPGKRSIRPQVRFPNGSTPPTGPPTVCKSPVPVRFLRFSG